MAEETHETARESTSLKGFKVRILFNTYVQLLSGKPGETRTLWIHRAIPAWAPLDLPNKGDYFLKHEPRRPGDTEDGCSIWRATKTARHMGDPDQWEVDAKFVPAKDLSPEQMAEVERVVAEYESRPPTRSL